MANILVVLRGRPGLGHVVPGLAIGTKLMHLGHRVYFITYGNGTTLLQTSGLTNWHSLNLPNCYTDWPGLELYPHGIKEIMPFAADFEADFMLFGGEYFLTPLLTLAGIKGGLIFNNGTFTKPSHNTWFHKMLNYLFSQCSCLFEMNSSAAKSDFISPDIYSRVLHGPFAIEVGAHVNDAGDNGLKILIGNGGGCSFPESVASYSTTGSTAAEWLEETLNKTRRSIKSVLLCLESGDVVRVYSCLPPAYNAMLVAEFEDDARCRIGSVSYDFHMDLTDADVLISRCGAGFVADATAYGGEIVAWPLSGHQEQLNNAERLRKIRPHSHVCSNEEDIDAAVSKAIALARNARPMLITSSRGDASMKAADAIIDCVKMSGRKMR